LRALKVVSIDSVPLNRMLIPPGTLWSPWYRTFRRRLRRTQGGFS
jgi:hypothetical protein